MRPLLPQLTTALLLLVCPAIAHGQRAAVDASFGVAERSWRLAVGALRQFRLGDRIQVGAGPRLTRFGGETRSYRAPDASSAFPRRIDLTPEVWALNLMVMSEVRLAGPLSAGANLDLAGVAGGPSQRVGRERLRPARGSLFLYGDNDRGSLNSEFYLRLAVARRLAVRAGASHYVTGYRVANGPERPRYLRFDTVPFIALRWSP
jgi:hypothetical protein